VTVFIDERFRPVAAIATRSPTREAQRGDGFPAALELLPGRPDLRPFLDAAEKRYGGIPALIDADKLLALAGEEAASGADLDSLLDRARVNWMGTDGMRGATVTHGHRGLAAFSALRRGVLAAEAVEYAAAAFTRLLGQNGLFAAGDSVCVGNDGRDRAAGGRYDAAMKRGFASAGARIRDLGVIPTPFVPHCALSLGVRGGAMLTASHNPASQNGIKFFADGRKLLPEGPLGEYALSALMWKEAFRAESRQNADRIGPFSPSAEDGTAANRDDVETLDWTPRAKEFLNAAVGESERRAIRNVLRGTPLVVDTASGAYHRLALDWLTEAGFDAVCVNDEPDGANINRGCGVARLEGRSTINAPEEAENAPAAEVLFRMGRARGTDAWGLALDGDGDRGFLLRYDAGRDRVEILDGDKEGLRVLFSGNRRKRDEGMDRKEGTPAAAPWAVFTIESDIMAAAAAESAGYRVATVGVGDRWLSSFSPPEGEGNLAIGVESSGHLIMPLPLEADPGPEGNGESRTGRRELRAGNGLVTALRALAASEYSAEAPYDAGFSKTRHVWNVNKALFRRGSALWNDDVRETEAALDAWRRDRARLQGTDEADIGVTREDKGDPDVLFWALRENGRIAATLFARNSGTEDKNAVYLKCRQELAPSLIPVAEALADRHAATLGRNA